MPPLALSSPSPSPAWAALRFALVPASPPHAAGASAFGHYHQEAAIRSLLHPGRYEHDALRCATSVPAGVAMEWWNAAQRLMSGWAAST